MRSSFVSALLFSLVFLGSCVGVNIPDKEDTDPPRKVQGEPDATVNTEEDTDLPDFNHTGEQCRVIAIEHQTDSKTVDGSVIKFKGEFSGSRVEGPVKAVRQVDELYLKDASLVSSSASFGFVDKLGVWVGKKDFSKSSATFLAWSRDFPAKKRVSLQTDSQRDLQGILSREWEVKWKGKANKPNNETDIHVDLTFRGVQCVE